MIGSPGRASSPMRSVSPARPKSPFVSSDNEECSPLYRAAMKKLYEASWRFDRGKNGDLLKTLDNRELGKLQFRNILRSCMNCKLSEEELDELMPLFNNNGSVDGCEFILLFYRLRYEFRSKLLTDRLMKDKLAREYQISKKKKKLEIAEQKVHINLVDDYTPDDLQSAMKKIIEAAVKYDRMMPGAVQLDAFECEFMSPHVFREQLKLVFNIQLSIPELSAFIRDFNKRNKDGDNIKCAAFIVHFFRWGFEEKSKRLHALWAEKKAYAEEKERKRQEEQAALERKNALKMSMDFTPEDKERAVMKLRTAARLYDKTTPGAMSMKSFDVKEMPPHVFKEQLKRIFNLNVNPQEMGALMSVFDINGDGAITCEEFSKVFLNMGFEEREKELKEAIAKQKRAEQHRVELEVRKKEELANKNSLKVSYVYTEEEFQSAFHKMVEAAWRYDKNMPGAPCLEAFESQYMEAHVFKEQLKMAFHMKVSPQELGALMTYFDPESTGKIECAAFLKKFTKVGIEERHRRSAAWRKHQKDQIEHRERVRQLQQTEADNKLALKDCDQTYTEADFQSAFSKLTLGALKYDRAGPGAVGLDAFEAITMPPHIFKEQLKLVFNVKITLPELWALMNYFDKDHTGVINCKYFINQFLRTGFEERYRIKQGWRAEQKQKLEKLEQIEEKRKADAHARGWAEVDFEFNEEEFESALAKYIFVCHQFDRRQLGPAGFSPFEVEMLKPAEFRETMKNTFNLKVTPRELGALVTYFDTQNKKMVNCSAFLNSFVQLRVICEEFKNKPGEQQKMHDLMVQLKNSYHARVMKGPSIDPKPWRAGAAGPAMGMPSAHTLKKKGSVAPTTAVAKYRLRVNVGKRTGRMDLACREEWEEDTDNNSTTTAGGNSPGKNGSNSPGKPKGKTAEPNSTATAAAVAGAAPESPARKDFELNEPTDEENAGRNVEPIPVGAEETLNQLLDEAREQHKLDQEEEAVMFGEGPNNGVTKSAKTEAVLVDFRLNRIPSEVLRLTDLTELWLDNNRIAVIPNQIGDLKNLKILSLTNNVVESLPPEVCLMESLKYLYLRRNRLTSLPNLLGRLRKLLEINLSDNKFTVFPEVLTSLPQLTVLDLSHNPITTPPPATLTEMKCLTLLNLEETRLGSTVCSALARTPWIFVKGCTIPKSVKASHEFVISPVEEAELLGMLKNRSVVTIATNARRKKIRSGGIVTAK